MTRCTMSVFRARNDSPVILRPLHISATRRLTTLPIELINDQRDMSVAGNKNAQIPSHNIADTVQHKTSLHFSIDGCQHLRRDMLIFSVSFQKTLTETRPSKKETTNIQRCSEPRVQQMSTAVDQTATIPRTRVSPRDPGEQHIVTRKTRVIVKN